MPTASQKPQNAPSCLSPLMLSDRLLSLAEDAGKAGCTATADQLLLLAHSVFDDVADLPIPAGTGKADLGVKDVPAAIFARRRFPVSGSALQVGR
jgi:hypothetical protein